VVKIGAPDGKTFPVPHLAPVMIFCTLKLGMDITTQHNAMVECVVQVIQETEPPLESA